MRIHEILVEDQQLDELSWADVKKGAGAAAGAIAAGARRLPGLAVQGADLAKRAAIGGYNAAKTGGRALNTVAGDLATGYDNAGKIVQRVAKTTGQTARGVAGGVRAIGDLGRSVGDAVSSTAQGAAGAVRSAGDIAGAAAGAVTNPLGGLVGGYGRGRDMQQSDGSYPGTASQGNVQQLSTPTQGQQTTISAGPQLQQQSAAQSLAAQYAKLKKSQKQSFQRQAGLSPAATPNLSVQQGGRSATPESKYYSKFLSKEI